MATCCPHCGRVHAHDGAGGEASGATASAPAGREVRDFSALLTGDRDARWNALADEGTPAVVTYRFFDARSMPPDVPAFSDFANDGYVPFTAGQQDAFRDALDLFSEAAGLLFVELGAGDGRAMVGVGRTTGSRYGGWADLPFVHGDGVIDSHLVVDGAGSFARGSWAFEIMLHEIGHAVGLKHPFDADFPNDAVLAFDLDRTDNTVMSYSYVSSARRDLGRYDARALQELYGAASGTDGWRAEARAGTIVLRAGGADDVLTNPGGAFTLRGGGGRDTFVPTGHDDRQYGEGGRDRLDGGGGDDALFGGAGADVIVGGWGDDRIEGGAGADHIDGDGPDVPAGAGGADDAIRGGAGADRIDAGEGNDRAWGGAGGDEVLGRSGNDRLWGNGGDDRLDGGEGADVLRGGAGADALLGGAGDDALLGEAGADRLSGGGAADRMDGGGGDDVLRGDGGGDALRGGRGDDRLLGGGGADRLAGGAGRDDLQGGGGADRLDGGGGRDRLDGGRGADRLDGGAGADRLAGGGGRDVLSGGRGDDRLIGGGGADVIEGGAGRDRLSGGAGRDTFVFSGTGGTDRIVDWQGRLDSIDLSALDAGRGPRIFERADGDAMLLYGDLKVRILDAGAGDFDEGSFLL